MSEFKWPSEGSGGSGTVVGPGTSTDNAVPRFDGTGGQTLQNSPVIIDDTGNITTPGTVDGRDVSTDGAALDSHVANMSNPHNVTKTQVGLGNVDNTSDVNKPVSTAQASAIALKIDLTQKGAANGVATLDAGGLIPSSQIPPVAITDTFVVASQAAQVALTAQVGDVAVRTDLNKSYILRVDPASTFANWQELLTPTDAVLSVNGQTGAVNLTKADVGLGNVDNTSDATKNAATATLTNKTISGANNTLTNIPAGQLTGTVAIANGGTAATTAATAFTNLSEGVAGAPTKGDIFARNTAAMARVPVGVNDTVLTADSTAATGVSWKPGFINPMTSVGDTVYGGAAGAPTRLAPNITTTKQFLTETGTGTVGQAPTWGTIAGTDVPQATSTTRGTVQGGAVPGNTSGTANGAGFIGQLMGSDQQTTANFPAANNAYGDAMSIILAPGLWLITALVDVGQNTSNMSQGILGVSPNSGNTATGMIDGLNVITFLPPTATNNTWASVPSYFVQISVSTTFYMKLRATYTTGTPVYRGRLSAARIG